MVLNVCVLSHSMLNEKILLTFYIFADLQTQIEKGIKILFTGDVQTSLLF